MPRPGHATYDLTHFATLLQAVDRAGFDSAVIGGCAVGAYAHLVESSNLSADLDLYMSPRRIFEFLDWAAREGREIVHRPMPRALQTAMLRWACLSPMWSWAGRASSRWVATRA